MTTGNREVKFGSWVTAAKRVNIPKKARMTCWHELLEQEMREGRKAIPERSHSPPCGHRPLCTWSLLPFVCFPVRVLLFVFFFSSNQPPILDKEFKNSRLIFRFLLQALPVRTHSPNSLNRHRNIKCSCSTMARRICTTSVHSAISILLASFSSTTDSHGISNFWLREKKFFVFRRTRALKRLTNWEREGRGSRVSHLRRRVWQFDRE